MHSGIKRKRAFRPTVSEVLEDRTVPSPFGLGNFFSGFGNFGQFFGRGGGGGGVVASVQAQDARQVGQEFQAFQQTYAQDVRTILLPSGTTNPANNRAAFDQAIAGALTNLNGSINTTIANLPAASSLAATIQGELLGTGPGTLQAELAGIMTPGATGFRSVRAVTRQASLFINQTAANVTFQVRSSPSAAGTISQETVVQVMNAVQSAFVDFSLSDANDIQTVLVPAGTTNPSANRPAFDQAVATALTTLNTSVGSALNILPPALSSTLATTLQNDVLAGGSTTGNSLQARLAALQTPSSAQGFSVFVFRKSSSFAIGSARGQVTRDILIAVNQYNASFTTG